MMKDIKNPTRITIESWDMKVAIERDHSDVSASDMIEMVASALIASGWNWPALAEGLKDYIDEQIELDEQD